MRRAGYFSVSVLSVLISAATTAAATTSPQMTRAEQMTSGTLIGMCSPSQTLDVMGLALMLMGVLVFLTGLAGLAVFELRHAMPGLKRGAGTGLNIHRHKAAAVAMQGGHQAVTMLAVLMLPVIWHGIGGQDHTDTAARLVLGSCQSGGFLLLDQHAIWLLSGICLASAFAAVWIHFVLWPWADRRVNAWLLARSAATGHAQP